MKVLHGIVVSRVFTIFTIYQLAHMIVYEIPNVLERRNKLIVIYDLLDLFVSDPHIDKADARQLVNEISGSR